MRPIPAEDFSALVGAIYDCALEPDRWPTTLAAVGGAMRFRTATLALQAMPSGRVLLDFSVGVERADAVEALSMSDQVIEAWGGMARVMSQPLDEPILLSRLNPDRVPADNPFHAWMRRLGLVDNMAILLTRGPDAISNVAFGRHVDDGPAGETELALGRLFVPHLKRAVVISRLLEAQSIRSTMLAAALDGLAVAVLLVGSDLRLLHANRAAEAMLRASDPLGLRQGRVRAPNGLAAALATALAARRGDIGRRGLGIPARRADGEEVVLHVLPLAGADPVPGAHAAIFVAPAVAPRPAPLAAIATLFDLTPAEARTLELVAAGRTNAEIAIALGVAVSTVRTHLLRVFEKTGTHRQADLIGLIASFSLPLA